MSILIRPVTDKKTLNDFVNLQLFIYKNNPYFVPQLIADEKKALVKATNPAMDFCDSMFWVAYKNGKAVGRIGALINPLINEKNNEKVGRITRTEFIDDNEVVDMLFDVAERWIMSKGMEKIMGPLGFTNLDHQGLLIEGHDWMPAVASDYHMDYYQKHFDRLGYQKEIDWLEFRITFPTEMPDKAWRVEEMVTNRYGLQLVEFETKADLKPYAVDLFNVFNEAFTNLFGTFQLPQKLKDFYINKYFPLLHPKFVKMVKSKEGEIAGFLVCMPSLAKALQKANGKLLPFGWYHLKKAFEKPTEVELMLTGIKPEMQKMGVVSVLMNNLWKTCKSYNIQYVETTGMLENNNVAIQMWKMFDHVQHKRKRCYFKDIK